MSAYFEYLRQMFLAVMGDIGNWFAAPWKDLPENFHDYNTLLSTYSPQFQFWGWFFYVIFWILLIGIIGGIGYLLYRLIRKYVKFYKRELDKDALQEQVERPIYPTFNPRILSFSWMA